MSDGVAGKVWVLRTGPLSPGGVRSRWILPDGTWVHAIEDKPIPPGRYFLMPDDTGRFRNWVIELASGSRCAVPAILDCFGVVAVRSRTDIEVHAGNTLDDTEGCVCPGLDTTAFGVADSAKAIAHMRKALRRDDPTPACWTLEIVE